jgi:hypothetical protein
LVSNGQLLIGSVGVNPVAATLTAGTGITITNGAGSITVTSSGGGLSTVDQTGASVTMAVNTQYIADNAGLVTLTLPAAAALGDTFRIIGKGAGGWLVQAGGGQTVHVGNVASSAAGSVASTNQWDGITIVCVTANTTFASYGLQGNLTVA